MKWSPVARPESRRRSAPSRAPACGARGGRSARTWGYTVCTGRAARQCAAASGAWARRSAWTPSRSPSTCTGIASASWLHAHTYIHMFRGERALYSGPRGQLTVTLRYIAAWEVQSTKLTTIWPFTFMYCTTGPGCWVLMGTDSSLNLFLAQVILRVALFFQFSSIEMFKTGKANATIQQVIKMLIYSCGLGKLFKHRVRASKFNCPVGYCQVSTVSALIYSNHLVCLMLHVRLMTCTSAATILYRPETKWSLRIVNIIDL